MSPNSAKGWERQRAAGYAATFEDEEPPEDEEPDPSDEVDDVEVDDSDLLPPDVSEEPPEDEEPLEDEELPEGLLLEDEL